MKKIAWIKYCGAIEIGYHLLGTQGNTDLRTSLLLEIIKQGVQLQIYSPLTRDTQKYIESVEGQELFGSVEFKISDKVDSDVDLLIVENGPTNITFSMRFQGEEIPSIAYANQIISNYKGVAFYVQTDLALPIVFNPDFFSFEYINSHLNKGNFKSMFKDKTWSVLTCAKNTEEFPEKYTPSRYTYGKYVGNGVLDVSNFEIHYGCLYGWEDFKIKKDTKHLLSYVGGERPRMSKFKKFFVDFSNEVEGAVVYGRWTDGTKNKHKSIEWGGVLEAGKSREVYNDSFATLVIGDVVYEKLGFLAGRFFEAVTAKTLPLLDSDLLNSVVSDILPKEILKEICVYNVEDLIDKVKLNGSQERVDLVKDIVKIMKGYSSLDSFNQLKDLYDKYSKIHKTKNQKMYHNKVIKTYVEEMEHRTSKCEFQMDYHNDFLTKYYELRGGFNVFGTENTSENFVHPVEQARCFRCGDLDETKKPRKRFLCEKCKQAKKPHTPRLRVNQYKFDKIFKEVNDLPF